jgi:hypothetical protein
MISRVNIWINYYCHHSSSSSSSSIISFFQDEELRWMDDETNDETDDETNGWKGQPPKILYK